jgi:hypothetical protein
VSLAAARKLSKEVSIEFSNMEKNPCLLHEIWVRYGMAVAS